jgi:hypothetical protein
MHEHDRSYVRCVAERTDSKFFCYSIDIILRQHSIHGSLHDTFLQLQMHMVRFKPLAHWTAPAFWHQLGIGAAQKILGPNGP